MKKKIAVLILTGLVVSSMCACGSKDTVNETTQEATEVVTEVSTEASTEVATQDDTQTEERVRDREDYVPIEKINVDECVELNEYKNMVVQASKKEVQDEEIKSYINGYVLVAYPVTDRAVVNGDTVTIDFVGKKDGVAFDGGTANGYSLKIGSGAFIPGFEEGLVGVMPGETKALNLTFPEDYHAEELKGQEVVFDVTVHNIMEKPEYDKVTSEQLALMQLEYKTKEEIWEYAAGVLDENAEAEFKSTVQSLICQNLLENSTYNSVPKHLVEEQVELYNSIIEAQLALYGVSIEDYAVMQGFSLEEFEKALESDAETDIKLRLSIEAIARAEGIEVTKQEIDETAMREVQAYNADINDVQEILDEIGESQIRFSILSEKVLDFLAENVTIEPVSAE